jgi:hypothetical protein
MAELDALGRTPEQAAKERAEIAEHIGWGGTDAQVRRERAEIAQEVRRTNYQADREARAIEKAHWIVASEDELWVRQAAEDAIRDGYDPEEARRYTRERLATTREERVHRAFADIIVDEP